MRLEFRLADVKDLEDIFQIFQTAIADMNSQHIFQWDEIYPDKCILYQDICKKQLYVGISDNEIVSAYVINQECDAEYKKGAWKFPESSYCVIHRLCVNPKFQNRGVGMMTMRQIENSVREMGFDAIRLDAYTRNPFAVSMYEKLNYDKVGYADWRKGRFYLMEKKL